MAKFMKSRSIVVSRTLKGLWSGKTDCILRAAVESAIPLVMVNLGAGVP
jgi:hypothetical protein